jgi:hypothetical protein
LFIIKLQKNPSVKYILYCTETIILINITEQQYRRISKYILIMTYIDTTLIIEKKFKKFTDIFIQHHLKCNIIYVKGLSNPTHLTRGKRRLPY